MERWHEHRVHIGTYEVQEFLSAARGGSFLHSRPTITELAIKPFLPKVWRLDYMRVGRKYDLFHCGTPTAQSDPRRLTYESGLVPLWRTGTQVSIDQPLAGSAAPLSTCRYCRNDGCSLLGSDVLFRRFTG